MAGGGMLRFGVIGAGAIGLEHIRNLEILAGARVSAVADTTEKSLGDAKKILLAAYFTLNGRFFKGFSPKTGAYERFWLKRAAIYCAIGSGEDVAYYSDVASTRRNPIRLLVCVFWREIAVCVLAVCVERLLVCLSSA